MSDIVERLRRIVTDWNRKTVNEAAAEIERLRAALQRLRDDQQPMADDSDEMTAAEDVLTWILMEVLHVTDDRSYTPHEAQKIIVAALSGKGEI